jgi:hypothetical protein
VYINLELIYIRHVLWIIYYLQHGIWKFLYYSITAACYMTSWGSDQRSSLY